MTVGYGMWTPLDVDCMDLTLYILCMLICQSMPVEGSWFVDIPAWLVFAITTLAFGTPMWWRHKKWFLAWWTSTGLAAMRWYFLNVKIAFKAQSADMVGCQGVIVKLVTVLTNCIVIICNYIWIYMNINYTYMNNCILNQLSYHIPCAKKHVTGTIVKFHQLIWK